MESPLFYVAIDKKGYQRKPSNIPVVKRYTSKQYGFYSLDQIADAVGNQGRAIIPSVLKGGLSQENFVSIQIFMLDFDGIKEDGKGVNLSFDEVKTRASKYGLNIAYAYKTLRCPDDEPFYKFRIAFVHRVLVDNDSIAKLIYRMLLKIFPEADPTCGEVSRIFLGGKKLIYKDIYARFDVVQLYHSIQDILNKDNHGYRNAKRLTKDTKIAIIDGVIAIEYLSNASIFGVKPDPANIYILAQSDLKPIFYIKSDFFAQQKNDLHQSDKREYKKDKSNILNIEYKGICRLYDTYMADEQELDHSERFLLLTNMKESRNGDKDFFNVMRQSRFYGEKTYEKWSNDYKGTIKKYNPKVCDNSCRFYEECRNTSTIVNRMKYSRKVIASKQELCSVEEAAASLHEKIVQSTGSYRTGIHLIKAQTGLGKTCELIRYVKEHPEKRILIAEPLCIKKTELYKDLCRIIPQDEIKNVLSVEDTPLLNKKIKQEYQNLHNSGRHKEAMKILRDELERVQKEEPECEYKIMELKEITDGVRDTDQYRIVLMTHARLLNTPEESIKKYDVVFIDEDILQSQLLTATHKISESYLQIIAEGNHQNHSYYTKDLLSIVELLEEKKVKLVSNKENLDSGTATGKLMLTMIGAIAEFERQNLLERQREGIAIAKRKGKYKGGQVKRIDDAVFQKKYDEYKERKINKMQLAKALEISRPTLDKILREKGL